MVSIQQNGKKEKDKYKTNKKETEECERWAGGWEEEVWCWGGGGCGCGGGGLVVGVGGGGGTHTSSECTTANKRMLT